MKQQAQKKKKGRPRTRIHYNSSQQRRCMCGAIQILWRGQYRCSRELLDKINKLVSEAEENEREGRT